MLLTPAKPTSLCKTGIKGTGSIDDELSKIIECTPKTPYFQLAVLPDKKKKMITWLELTQLVSAQDFQQKGNSSEDDFSADVSKSPKLLSPEEEKEQPKKRSLLEIAQWAKEQNFQWKSSPSTNEDIEEILVQAYKEGSLLSDCDDEETEDDVSFLNKGIRDEKEIL